MQITSSPILPNMIPGFAQEAMDKIPAVAQVMAVSPIGARPVDPATSGKAGRKTRHKDDETANDGDNAGNAGKRGNKLNIRV